MKNRFLYFQKPYNLAIIWAVLWCVGTFIVNTHTLMYQDNGWLLYAAQRMTNGDVPYVDFYETNPPLILWICVIPAWIAQLLHLNAIDTFYGFILLLGTLSLALTLQELKKHPVFLNKPLVGSIVFAVLGQFVVGSSKIFFGQREHLFILLAMPYFIQSSYVTQEPQWRARQLLIALMAGIGFSIKPYFALIWMTGEILCALLERNIALLLRRTNWLIAATGLLYCVCVGVFSPHYIHDILPMLLVTYHAFTAAQGGLFVPLSLLFITYSLPVILVRFDSVQRLFISKLGCWFIVALFTAWVQYKGWLNHYLPAMFFGMILFAFAFAITLQRWIENEIQHNHKHFAVLWALACFVIGPPILFINVARGLEHTQEIYLDKLRPYVVQYHGNDKPLYVLSFQLGRVFPAINYLPVTFPFHFHHLWPLPGILNAENKGNVTIEMQRIRDFTLHTIARDFSKFTPALVLVDNNCAWIEMGLKNYDFIPYFKQDALFREQWSHYRKVGDIVMDEGDANHPKEQYTVYSRIVGNHL